MLLCQQRKERSYMTGSVHVNKGKWYCVLNMKDENGRRKQKWFSTGLSEKGNKKKAEAILQKLKIQYGDCDKITKYAEMPFADYCDVWLEGKKDSVEITTYQGYEIRVSHIKDFFLPRKTILSKVVPRDVKEFYEYLLHNGNKAKYKHSNGLSQRTIKEIALLLKAILKEAVLLGDITYNPAENIPVPKKKQERVRQEAFLDEDDMKILLSEIKGHVLEELIIVTLFYGLRRSEVLGLKWSAVDFDKCEVHISHTIVKVKEKVAKDTTKTEASFRTYPLSDYIRDILLKVKNRQEHYKLLIGNEYQKSDYIFTWQDGRPISPDYVTKAFKKIVERSEELSSELTFHDLRKSCVSMMVEDGYSIKEIQKWVGHADAKTTMNIYAKVKESKKKVIGDRLSEKFNQAI